MFSYFIVIFWSSNVFLPSSKVNADVASIAVASVGGALARHTGASRLRQRPLSLSLSVWNIFHRKLSCAEKRPCSVLATGYIMSQLSSWKFCTKSEKQRLADYSCLSLYVHVCKYDIEILISCERQLKYRGVRVSVLNTSLALGTFESKLKSLRAWMGWSLLPASP